MKNAEVVLEGSAAQKTLKLGFVGTGWIGRMRLESLLQEKFSSHCTVFDTSADALAEAAALSPDIKVSSSMNEMLESDIDGVVIATPSAMHAEQCLRALEAGKAVFCQKPLARDRDETFAVVEASRTADRLLAVDFCYRHLAGMERLRQIVGAGELGTIYAVDLLFHNAYGPDKPWFYQVGSAGGGCVMDLGIHLVDLVFWLLGGGKVDAVSSSLFHQGRRLQPPFGEVEDYATAEFLLDQTLVRLCCSWNLHAGRDAIIEAHFHGTAGGGLLRNVNGSFYDFQVCRHDGTQETVLGSFPDPWGGRALLDWAMRLGRSDRYDARIEQVVQVADTIDRIYCR